MQIALPNQLSVFVDEQVQNGRHVSPAEVVIAARHSYENALAAEQGRLDEIRAVIREGSAAIDRGDYVLVSNVEESEAPRKR
jgi:Arc/MetJ-type ribon-helix-helix transcriptional regulator